MFSFTGHRVALPADDVERVPREPQRRELAVALDAHLELAGLVVRVGLGHLEHARIELRVLAHQPAVGDVELARYLR